MSGAGAAPKSAVTPSSGRRLAGIEGLRALAAGSIVLVHVWGFSTPGGALGGPSLEDALSTLSVGVTLFFTLSGFLLYRPFAASIARGKPHLPIRAYAVNRVLRIAPAYLVILAVVSLVGAAQIRHATEVGLGRLSDPVGFLQAAFLLQDYRPATLLEGIGPAWSLAVEAVFYVLLPLLVVAAATLARGVAGRRRRVLVLLGPPLLLLLVGLSGKYATHLLAGGPRSGFDYSWHSVLERSFWAQADLFSFGMALAVVHTEFVDGRLRLPRYWRRMVLGAALAVFVPCAYTMHGAEQSYLPQNTGEALGIALAFATVVLVDEAAPPLRATRLLESRPFVLAGVASYSVFLWHQPIILWLRAHGLTLSGWGGLAVNLVLVVPIVAALSAVTYAYVERPALRRKSSTSPRPSTVEESARSLPVAAAADA